VCEQRKHGSVGAGAGNRPCYPTANRGAVPLTVTGRRSYPRCVLALRLTCDVPHVVYELLVSEVVLDKLGAHDISREEVDQLVRYRPVMVRNPRGGGQPGERRLLVGQTDGGRVLTLAIEPTLDPTTWLVVTGWSASDRERRILARRR
jgi:hypothetical protein